MKCICTKCNQPILSHESAHQLAPPKYAHAKCPEPTFEGAKIVADENVPSSAGFGYGFRQADFMNTYGKPMNKEPELSLLVIDLGYACLVKTEKGETAVQIGNGTWICSPDNGNSVQTFWRSFADVRSAIDVALTAKKEAEPPVPRIEHREDVHGNWWYWLWHKADVYSAIELKHYDALCKVAGVTIPVYEPTKGTWTQVVSSGKFDPLGMSRKIDFEAWRYER